MALYAVGAVAVLAPFLVGSGPAWAQVISSTAAFAAVAIFAVSRKFTLRSAPFALPAAVAVGMTLFQLLPLPGFLVRLLSPHAFELRSDAQDAIPRLLPLTLDVPATLIEVAKGMAGLGLLVVVAASVHRSRRARPLILVLAFVGAAIGLSYIAHHLFGIQGVYGLYKVRDIPGPGVFGSFVNGNQAASLLALSALTAIGLAVETSGPLSVLAVLSALMSMGVLVAASSRAAAVAFGLAGCVLASLLLSRRFGVKRAVIIALALVGVVALGAVSTSEGLRGRLMASTPGNPVQEQKIRGWADAFHVIADYPFTGVGRGAFEGPATKYRSDIEGVRLVFPENVVLQMASEWGLPITLILIGLAALAGKQVLPAITRVEPSVQGAACGVLAVLLHELADFGLELPGVAFPTVIALGIVVARTQQKQDPSRSLSGRVGPRWVLPIFAVWTAALAGAWWAFPRTLQADGERGIAAVVKRRDTRAELNAAILRHPADYYLEVLAATESMQARDGKAGRHLNRAQRLNPADPGVHLTTARWLAGAKRASQAAIEYRLAGEHGWNSDTGEILHNVGIRYLAQAVPQKAANLLDVAGILLRHKDLAGAQETSQRAVRLDPALEGPYVKQLDLALESHSPPFIVEATRELLKVANEPASFIAAAEALASIGQLASASEAIDRGLDNNPGDSRLVLSGAQLKLKHDDLVGAMTVLQRGKDSTYTLSDRIALEELRATIAEKRGDNAMAAVLRARARALARRTSATADLPP